MVSMWSVLTLPQLPSLLLSRVFHLQPARVTAHTVPTKEHPNRTVILVKLDQVIMDREEGLGK